MAQPDFPSISELDSWVSRLKQLTRAGREATQVMARMREERERLARLGIRLDIAEPHENEEGEARA